MLFDCHAVVRVTTLPPTINLKLYQKQTLVLTQGWMHWWRAGVWWGGGIIGREEITEGKFVIIYKEGGNVSISNYMILVLAML